MPITERQASSLEHFPRSRTVNVELPGTAGPDGLPLVVTVKALPPVVAMRYGRDMKGKADDSPEVAAMMSEAAQHGVVAPRLRFDGANLDHYADTGDRSWDDLPLAAQMEVFTRVMDLTLEGMGVATKVAEEFRGEGGVGARDGGAGGGPGRNLAHADAPVEPDWNS